MTRGQLITAGAGLTAAGIGGYGIIYRLASKDTSPKNEDKDNNIGMYYQLGTVMPVVDAAKINRLYGAFALPNKNGELDYPTSLANLATALGNRATSTELTLSVGGWGDYSDAWHTATTNHQRFAESADRIRRQFNEETGSTLAGFDLDIENIPGGIPFSMVGTLATALKSRMGDIVVTAAVPANPSGMTGTIKDLTAIDEIGIMSYDKSGNWSDTADDMAPGVGAIKDVDGWITAGVDPARIRLMLPTYGRYFIGASKKGDAFNNDKRVDNAVLFTEIPKGMDDESTLSSWAQDGDRLISYQSPEMIRQTVARLHDRHPDLAGVGFWSNAGLTDAHLNAATY